MRTQASGSTPPLATWLALLALFSPPTFAHDTLSNVSEVFNQSIPNIPGKSMIAVQVDYAPGEKTPSHRHDRASFIMAYVVKGAIRSQVDDAPARIYHAGETWFENPGAHHVISENASTTEPARLLAVFVTDTDHEALTTLDE